VIPPPASAVPPGHGDEGGFAELTLEARDLERLEAFYTTRSASGSLDEMVARLRSHGAGVRGPGDHPGGDRSIYVEDPEGNVVEVWDFFHRGEGARDGTHAFTGS
jgi:catechol 2,3-dioxygenase-like lactoylglutathione lyase family enzyme